VQLEISPEPSREERAAIEAALERALGDVPAESHEAWWEAGARENGEELDD
jgi:hypothetical protein